MQLPAKSLSPQRRRTRLTNPHCSSLPKDQPAHTLPLHSTSLSWNQPLQGGSSTRADSGCSLLSTACLAQSSQSLCQCLSLLSPTGNHLYSEGFKGAVVSVLQFLSSLLALVSTEGWERVLGSICLEGGSKRGGGETMPCLKCGLCSQIQLQLGRQPLKHPLSWLWEVLLGCLPGGKL